MVRVALPAGSRGGHGERGLLLDWVEGNSGWLVFAVGGDGDALEGDLDGVQGDVVSRLGEGDVDGFCAREGCSPKVWRERKGVVRRDDGLRQALCAGWRGKKAETGKRGGKGGAQSAERNSGRTNLHWNPF